MKVALVHDYIKEYGGAERVLEALHEIWPDAPVYTTVYLPEFLGPHRQRFKDWNIRTSWLQYLPLKEKLISPFRLIAPLVFRQFDFSNFDVVIVSATGAYSPNGIKITNHKSKIKNTNENSKMENCKTLHICYCHTPPRHLYGYATARDWKKSIILRSIGEIANHFLRLIDFKSSKNVDYFIANSNNVAGRIRKFYRRKAKVIYPPIEIPNSKFQIPNKSQNTKYKIQNTEYFLAGGRIARPKHIDLIVEAFEKLNLTLKVFGRGFAGYDQKLKNKNEKIEFVGEVSDEEKFELMRNAKAYIFASVDEDFGITPVEAMSVGTPVIAYKSGGVLETVIDPSTDSGSPTGLFFDELTIGSLVMAINKFKTLKFDKVAIIKHAQKFSKERFKKEIKEFVIEKIINI